MNILIVSGMSVQNAAPAFAAGDFCALFFLCAGAASLGAAAYLLYKGPRLEEERVEFRRRRSY